MSKLSELKPSDKELVRDLLKRAGIRVEMTRYFLSKCAFTQDKIVVLNFWYEKQITQRGENIIIRLNWLPTASKPGSYRDRTVRDAIKLAYENNLKIRIIVLDGDTEPECKVKKRSLDPITWSVESYNEETGKCVLVRDGDATGGSKIKQESAIDDLDDVPEGSDVPDRAKKNVTQVVIKRDNRLRAYVLKRARGRCEYCNGLGFLMENDKHYLEAHHIIALSNSGKDTVDNVIALCPQHHRQAHYGADAESIEKEFMNILKMLNRKNIRGKAL
jgi:5-methylcytosine-specific restriction protein A